MRNLIYLSLAVFVTCALFSCKKQIVGGKSNASLLTGKWLLYQQSTKVYDLNSNALLKDTVVDYATTNYPKAWFEIYNIDGTAYITTTPYKKAGATTSSVDTTSYFHYTILGSSVVLSQNGGGSETDPIIQLTQSTLVQEKTQISPPPSGWGLDTNTAYKFVNDGYYNKQ